MSNSNDLTSKLNDLGLKLALMKYLNYEEGEQETSVLKNPSLSKSRDIFSIGISNVTNGSSGPTGPTGPTGPVGIQGLDGPTGPTGPVSTFPAISITSVDESFYFASISDFYIGVDYLEEVAITLPLGEPGKIFIIKDEKGNSESFPITIFATSSTIDGASNAVIASNYGSLTLIFNGSEWHLI